ncbi:unnamed protein product [Closterium sp. NIES-64]|nr:unnamed protein product [Closterium sp. NIES-64]
MAASASPPRRGPRWPRGSRPPRATPLRGSSASASSSDRGASAGDGAPLRQNALTNFSPLTTGVATGKAAQCVPVDLRLAVLLGGLAFEAYSTPEQGSDKLSDKDGQGCEALFTSTPFAHELFQGQLSGNIMARHAELALVTSAGKPATWNGVACTSKAENLKNPSWGQQQQLQLQLLVPGILLWMVPRDNTSPDEPIVARTTAAAGASWCFVGPGGALLAAGGALLAAGGALLAPGGALLAPGGALLAAGGALLAPGGALLAPGGALLAPGGALLAPFGALLAPGGALLLPGGALLAPGGALLTPGGALLAPGGALLAPGGALLVPGESFLPRRDVDAAGAADAADAAVAAGAADAADDADVINLHYWNADNDDDDTNDYVVGTATIALNDLIKGSNTQIPEVVGLTLTHDDKKTGSVSMEVCGREVGLG